MPKQNDWTGISEDTVYRTLLEFNFIQGMTEMSGDTIRKHVRSGRVNSITNLSQRLGAVSLNSTRLPNEIQIELSTNLIASRVDECMREDELHRHFNALRNLGFVLAFAAPPNLAFKVDEYEAVLESKGFKPIRTQGVLPGVDYTLQTTDLWLSKMEIAELMKSKEPNLMRTHTITEQLRLWIGGEAE